MAKLYTSVCVTQEWLQKAVGYKHSFSHNDIDNQGNMVGNHGNLWPLSQWSISGEQKGGRTHHLNTRWVGGRT